MSYYEYIFLNYVWKRLQAVTAAKSNLIDTYIPDILAINRSQHENRKKEQLRYRVSPNERDNIFQERKEWKNGHLIDRASILPANRIDTVVLH